MPPACTAEDLPAALEHARTSEAIRYFSGGESVVDIYIYCLFAAFALILGDASYAQYTTTQRTLGVAVMLAGELTMAVVFGQVIVSTNENITYYLLLTIYYLLLTLTTYYLLLTTYDLLLATYYLLLTTYYLLLTTQYTAYCFTGDRLYQREHSAEGDLSLPHAIGE